MAHSGTLLLAAHIAAMDRDRLRALLLARKVANRADIGDPLALALELLRPDSIQRALHAVDRPTLSALADWGHDSPPDTPEAERLTHLALLGRDADSGALVALPEVSAQLHDILTAAGITANDLAVGTAANAGADTALGSAAQHQHEHQHPHARTREPVGDHTWFAAALTQVRQATLVLRSIRARAPRLSRRGAIPAALSKSLAETLHTNADTVERLLRTLELAELTVRGTDASGYPTLHATARSESWAAASAPQRWLTLATARVAALSEPLRAVISSEAGNLTSIFVDALTHAYPLLPSTQIHQMQESLAAAGDLGLTLGGQLTDAAWALLSGDKVAAAHEADAAFPPVVPGVYLQPDLSLIVPGPLGSDDESALLDLSEIEQLGVALSLRITAVSLNRAFDGVPGSTPWSVERVRELLGRLSLTGIPQPLEYLLDDADRNHGSIRVRPRGVTGSLIVTNRPETRETLLVDRSLQHLGLVADADGTALHSRAHIDHVMAALGAARYPASRTPAYEHDAVDRTPEDVAPAPGERPAADTPVAEADTASSSTPASELDALVDRLIAAAQSDTGAIERRLDLAIRERGTVLVTASARGQERVFTLAPVSVANGRLRASDTAAGVERTLPLTAITAVDPVPSGG